MPKDREAKAAREEEKKELAQTKAQLEVLVMKNQELTQANMQLEAFKDLIFGLAFVAVIVFVDMALTSERARKQIDLESSHRAKLRCPKNANFASTYVYEG